MLRTEAIEPCEAYPKLPEHRPFEKDVLSPLLTHIHKAVISGKSYMTDGDTGKEIHIEPSGISYENPWVRYSRYVQDDARLTLHFLTPELRTQEALDDAFRTYTLQPLHCAYGDSGESLHGDIQLSSPMVLKDKADMPEEVSYLLDNLGIQWSDVTYAVDEHRISVLSGDIPRPIVDMVSPEIYGQLSWLLGYVDSPAARTGNYSEFFDPIVYRAFHIAAQLLVNRGYLVQQDVDGKKQFDIHYKMGLQTHPHESVIQRILLRAIGMPTTWCGGEYAKVRQNWILDKWRELPSYVTTDTMHLTLDVMLPHHEYRCGVTTYEAFQQAIQQAVFVPSGEYVWSTEHMIDTKASKLGHVPPGIFRRIHVGDTRIVVGLSSSSGICKTHLSEIMKIYKPTF